MTLNGQDAFDAVSAEFNQAAAALVQQAGALKPGRNRDALIATTQAELTATQEIVAQLGRGGVPGDEFLAGLEVIRAATQRLQALDGAPKKGLFRRR